MATNNVLRFIKSGAGQAEQAIFNSINSSLSDGKKVLWLVSGGSNIQTQVNIMAQLANSLDGKLKNLTILPMDERYGLFDHSDSNSAGLRKAGFEPHGANWIDVLECNLRFDETVEYYEDQADKAFKNADVIIGQFGLGGDAHVAGILPESPAAEGTENSVVGYEWNDYTRMTLSPKAIQQISVAYVLAYGDNKAEALDRLRENKEPVSKMPGSLLYKIPEVYVYNSYIEGEI